MEKSYLVLMFVEGKPMLVISSEDNSGIRGFHTIDEIVNSFIEFETEIKAGGIDGEMAIKALMLLNPTVIEVESVDQLKPLFLDGPFHVEGPTEFDGVDMKDEVLQFKVCTVLDKILERTGVQVSSDVKTHETHVQQSVAGQ